MGMFDYVKCNYPLPGQKLEFVDEFQTKSLNCVLATETITEDGKLQGRDDFTGVIEFYGSNVVASGPAGWYTRNGEDAESVTYEAVFVSGELKTIKQVGYERKPVLASSEMHLRDRKGSELNENDSFVGKKLFLCWGGREVEEGYEVEVVHETEKQLCIKTEDGQLELMHRFDIGNILFKDFAEAKADKEYVKEQIQKEKDDYQRKLAERGHVEN